MARNIELLAQALKGAEAAHAKYEKETADTPKKEWPEFYAEWLIDNTLIGSIPTFHATSKGLPT